MKTFKAPQHIYACHPWLRARPTLVVTVALEAPPLMMYMAAAAIAAITLTARLLYLRHFLLAL
jgi:hypothetical protein